MIDGAKVIGIFEMNKKQSLKNVISDDFFMLLLD